MNISIKTLCIAFFATNLSLASSGASAIVGGTPASNAKYRAVVSIDSLFVGSCTGFMVADRWAVTSRDCVTKQNGKKIKAKNSYVTVGKTYDELYVDGSGFRPGEKIIIHPNYSDTNPLANNIALIKLKSKPPRKFTPIKIAGSYIDQDTTEPGDKMTAVGYGASNVAADEYLFDRMKINFDILSGKTCREKFEPSDRKYYDIAGKENVLCAARLERIDKGTCYGDAGGPLITDYQGELFVTGLLTRWTNSAGDFTVGNCKSKNEASVYLRLAPYKNWIYKTIKNN